MWFSLHFCFVSFCFVGYFVYFVSLNCLTPQLEQKKLKQHFKVDKWSETNKSIRFWVGPKQNTSQIFNNELKSINTGQNKSRTALFQLLLRSTILHFKLAYFGRYMDHFRCSVCCDQKCEFHLYACSSLQLIILVTVFSRHLIFQLCHFFLCLKLEFGLAKIVQMYDRFNVVFVKEHFG